MNTTKKLVIAVVALSLALVAFAGVSLAWLVSQSTTVENTFSIGKVAITLDEAKVDVYGDKVDNNGDSVIDDKDRVTANTYKIVPGEEYTKDPIVHVAVESEPCYVYVKLVNPLVPIIADTTIEAQMTANGWSLLDATNGIWVYNTIVDAREEAKNIPVFASFTIKGDEVSNTDDAVNKISDYENAKILVTAYAVQSANMASAQDAWETTFGK